MITDLNVLDDGAVIEADVGIIGGGAAGIALADQMLGDPVSVALIESGGLEFEPDTQALHEGEISGLDYFLLDAARLRFFGGSTNHWGGQSIPLDSIDFDEREWVPDSGWPVSHEEFSRYLPRAEQYCRLTLEEAGQAVWELGPEMPAFPLEGTGFRPILLRFPTPPFSFGSVYRRGLERSGNVTCYLHANAIGFDTDPGRRRIEGMRLASLDGRRATLRARNYVLAAGGLENCRLLLAAGLGNDHDLVGRYAMEHPNLDTGVVLLERDPYLRRAYRTIGTQRVRFDFGLSPEIQAEAQLLNHSAYLLPLPEERRGGAAGLWDRISNRLTGPDPEAFQLRVRLEHAPYPDSRITLTDATDALGLPRINLHYRLGELEERTVRHVCESFARALGMADLGRMQVDFDPASWLGQVDWQYHHCGGTRMHADPRRGVVDADCKVHGIDNLYVAGSSVFPTCGHANSTMNLLALAIRLSDHLRAGRQQ